MKKETNPPLPLHAFVESRIGLEISAEATARLGPVPKPPWYKQVKDRNLEALRKVTPWLVGNVAWELGTRFFGFSRQDQPAAAPTLTEPILSDGPPL